MSIKGKRNAEHRGEQRFLTLQEINDGKVGMDVLPKQLSALVAIPLAIVSITPVLEGKRIDHYILNIVAHGMRLNDVVRVRSGLAFNSEFYADEIIDANNIKCVTIPSGLIATDVMLPMRHMTQTVDADGNLITAQGPLQFIQDAVSVEVTEDTVDPANNIPLPVKITGLTGDINITAQDLNVQLSHLGATPDSTLIGDGVETWEIDADGSGTVRDADAIAQLTAISGKLPATLGQKLSAASLAVALSTSQEAIIQGILTDTTSLEGKDFATQTTLAAVLAFLNAEDFSSETTLAALSAKFNSLGQKASAASAPMVLSTEQEAILSGILADTSALDGKDFATQTTLAALLAAFNAEDFATQTTLAAVLADTSSIAAEDFATQTTLAALLAAFNAEDFATQTTLAAQAANIALIAAEDFATETTLAAQAANIALIEGKVATEAKQDNIITELQALVAGSANLNVIDQADDELFSFAGTPVNTGGFTQIVAVTAAIVKKIQIVEDVGEFMYLAIGAASSEAFACNLPLGGGEVEVEIPAGTRLSLRSHLNTIDTGYMTLNLLG